MDPGAIPFDVHPHMLVRLAVAMLLGALVGYERERMGKPAGVRTHGMVSLGAALFTVVSLQGFEGGETRPVWPRRSSPASASSAPGPSSTPGPACKG